MNDSLIDNIATLAQVAPILEAHGLDIISATADPKGAKLQIYGSIADARKLGNYWRIDSLGTTGMHLSHTLDGATVVIILNINTRDLYRRDDLIDLSLYDGGAA